MSLKFLFITTLSLSAVQAFPQKVVHNVVNNDVSATETCEAVMARNGVDLKSFRDGAVHGIHSLYLEEIRHFFEPDAPADNGIPVVNADLTAEQMVLPNSPLAGFDDDFNTMALKVMAFFMTNNRPHFYIEGTNVLERINHQYHMHEIYEAAAPIYQRMKENPPSDPGLCACANDIQRNGIFSDLGLVVQSLRKFNDKEDEGYLEFQPKFNYMLNGNKDSKESQGYLEFQPKFNYMLNAKKESKERKDYLEFQPKFNYMLNANKESEENKIVDLWQDKENKESKKSKVFDLWQNKENKEIKDNKVFDLWQNKESKESKVDLIWPLWQNKRSKETGVKVSRADPWTPNTLVGPDQWISFGAMLKKSMLSEEELEGFATFMYCKLNIH